MNRTLVVIFLVDLNEKSVQNFSFFDYICVT